MTFDREMDDAFNGRLAMTDEEGVVPATAALETKVFKGAHGLVGLLNAQEFWDSQNYGTRLYYGPGGLDYLHRDVLRAAVELLAEKERDRALIEAGRMAISAMGQFRAFGFIRPANLTDKIIEAWKKAEGE